MNKILYTFLFLTFFIFAKEKGIPGTEIELYRIVLPQGKTLDPKILIPDLYLKPLGKSKQSIATALSDVQVTIESDQWTGKDMITYHLGPTFWFWFDNFNNFDSFGFGNMGKTTNFILSKKYQIRPGFPMPIAVLNDFEYQFYSNMGTVEYSFLVTTPNGDFATNLLTITVKDSKIETIRYGYSE